MLSLLLLATASPAPPSGGMHAPDEDQVQALDPSLERRHDRPSESLQTEDVDPLTRFLLEWGGVRRFLEERGVSVDVLFTVDGSWAATGGLEPGATALRSLLDVGFTLDAGRALCLEGGTFFAAVQWIAGENGSAQVGALQDLSNIDADDRFDVPRLWFEQLAPGSGTRVRAGWIDANSTFATADNAQGFIHASMGFSPTILGMPTYPKPALGLTLDQPIGDFAARAGVFDGSDTGRRGDLFLIGQLDATWDGARTGRLGVGAWHHTATFARFDGGKEEGTQGIFAVLDQRLWTDRSDAERQLSVFAQFGLADPDVSALTAHVGAGLSLDRPFCPQLSDVLGIGISAVRLTDEPGAGFDFDSETALEIHYGVEPLPWLRFKPVVQVVRHPGGVATVGDAVVLSFRTTVAF